jgi:hypothetical protein
MDRNEFEQKKDRQQSRIKSFYNMGMGILWLVVGIFFLSHKRFGMEGAFDPLLANIFGGSCVLYGLFRLWRGFKSNSAI